MFGWVDRHERAYAIVPLTDAREWLGLERSCAFPTAGAAYAWQAGKNSEGTQQYLWITVDLKNNVNIQMQKGYKPDVNFSFHGMIVYGRDAREEKELLLLRLKELSVRGKRVTAPDYQDVEKFFIALRESIQGNTTPDVGTSSSDFAVRRDKYPISFRASTDTPGL